MNENPLPVAISGYVIAAVGAALVLFGVNEASPFLVISGYVVASLGAAGCFVGLIALGVAMGTRRERTKRP